MNISLDRVNDGDGVESTLLQHEAKWHKACYVACNGTIVERARKAAQQHQKAHGDNVQSSVKNRLRNAECFKGAKKPDGKTVTCLFCDNHDGVLHTAETLEIDTSLQSMATELRDSQVLTKLSSGDAVALDVAYHRNCYITFIFTTDFVYPHEDDSKWIQLL